MSRKSPFPGMDPWLEDYWGDVHTSLTAYARDRLQTHLPRGLRAHIEEYVTIEAQLDDQSWRHHYVPDVMITEKQRPASTVEETSVATLLDSDVVRLPRIVEPPTLRRLQIIDTQTGNRVITSIEFLSPANKIGRGIGLFQKKQQEFLECGVNLVEIDLLRTGDWAVSIDIGLVPVNQRGIYRALVVRALTQDECEYYPIPISAPLPKIKIPLRPSDADVLLELQPILEMAYINGNYAEEINYSRSPATPLPSVIAEWAENVLKQPTQNQ